jgi:hypothetical protein
MPHADERNASGTHDGEVACRAGFWLVGPDLSPLSCDGGSILLCLERRASTGHEERPTIPGPAVSTFLF